MASFPCLSPAQAGRVGVSEAPSWPGLGRSMDPGLLTLNAPSCRWGSALESSWLSRAGSANSFLHGPSPGHRRASGAKAVAACLQGAPGHTLFRAEGLPRPLVTAKAQLRPRQGGAWPDGPRSSASGPSGRLSLPGKVWAGFVVCLQELIFLFIYFSRSKQLWPTDRPGTRN